VEQLPLTQIIMRYTIKSVDTFKLKENTNFYHNFGPFEHANETSGSIKGGAVNYLTS
jgi:hypothetical protein